MKNEKIWSQKSHDTGPLNENSKDRCADTGPATLFIYFILKKKIKFS